MDLKQQEFRSAIRIHRVQGLLAPFEIFDKKGETQPLQAARSFNLQKDNLTLCNELSSAMIGPWNCLISTAAVFELAMNSRKVSSSINNALHRANRSSTRADPSGADAF